MWRVSSKENRNFALFTSAIWKEYTVKKGLTISPSPAGMSLSLAGNNNSRPGRVWLVTSRLGTGKSLTFFYSVVGMKEVVWAYTVYPHCHESIIIFCFFLRWYFMHSVLTPPPLLSVAMAGRNHLNEWNTPLFPTGIGERYSQTISNLCQAALSRRCVPPYKQVTVLN